jgi:tyrosine-protein kinase Etk/Wzc
MNDVSRTTVPAPNEELTLLDVALVMARHAKLLIIAPLLAAACVLGVTYLIRPSYTATTRILPPQQQQSAAAGLLASQLGALAGLSGAALGIKNPADTYAAMIKSRTVADRLIARFNLRQLYERENGDDARKELASRTKVVVGKDGLITIDVDDHDPKRAAELANAYVRELHELTQSLAVSEAAQRRVFFERQLKQAKEDLTKAEQELRSSGISEAALKTMPQSAVESVARLKAQVTAQEVKIGAMRGYLTESSPEFRQALQELAALRQQLGKAEQANGGDSRGAGTEYVAKFREFKYQEALFDLMAKQYEMARLDEAREGSIVQVVDVAIPPERKSKPYRALMTAGTAVLAFILLFTYLLLSEWLRNIFSTDPKAGEKVARLKRELGFRRK